MTLVLNKIQNLMAYNRDLHLKIFECCIPVKGAKRSLICDLQRNSYEFIPNIMVEFIRKYDRQLVADIYADFSNDESELVIEYIDFLVTKEFAFLTKDPTYYPELSRTFELPFDITNAIIDNNTFSNHNYLKILTDLDLLGCQAIELRFFDLVDFQLLFNILTICETKSFRSIELLVKFNDQIGSKVEEISSLIETFKQLTYIIVHSCPDDLNASNLKDDKLLWNSQVLTDETCCGNISASNFVVNQDIFFESNSWNSCLNKKISIDKSGLIKNCPSMVKHYGSVNEKSLIEVVDNSSFKSLWNVTKDQIDICSDCEFRYICTDCRAYLKDSSNIFSKPLKCKYDPYSATWC